MSTVDAHTVFLYGNVVFAAALTKMGITALLDPKISADGFGLPAASEETLAYQPVWGVRDLGFGAAIAWLTALESMSFVDSGGRAAAIVTLVGSFVGISDSFIVRNAGGEGAEAHALGALAMAISAIGSLATS